MKRPYILLDIDDFKYAGNLPAEEGVGLALGDVIDVRLMQIDDDAGLALVSRDQLLEDKAWEEITNDVEHGTVISFFPKTVTKGGIIGRINDHLEGFLPASKTNVSRFYELSKLLEQDLLEVVALEAERERGNVLVSMNAALEQKQNGLLSQYKTGEVYELEVAGLSDFGIFIKLDEAGTITGLLHASELSYKAGKQKPSDYASIGEKLQVKLIKISNGKKGPRVSFSRKKLFDPWAEAAEEMKAGQKVSGKVINIQQGLGSFISLGKYPRVVGLLRDESLEKGQFVKVHLDTFDPITRKSRLSLV